MQPENVLFSLLRMCELVPSASAAVSAKYRDLINLPLCVSLCSFVSRLSEVLVLGLRTKEGIPEKVDLSRPFVRLNCVSRLFLHTCLLFFQQRWKNFGAELSLQDLFGSDSYVHEMMTENLLTLSER